MNILIKFFVLIIFTLYLCSCASTVLSKEHPKDEKMIESFQSHKAEFNQLLQMFLEDKSLGRVGDNFTRTANFFEKCESPNSWNGKEVEVTEERLKEYRNLFTVLSLSKGIAGYCEKDTILFYASTQGLSVTGSTKGYAYLAKPPKISVDNLDNYWSSDNKSFTAFRHIEGNWYLYFDYED